MKKLIVWILMCTALVLNVESQPKKHEMRAVWIATVANIDWPSAPGLSTQQQRDEMITLLDKLAEDKINTIVLQIRPTADAFFPSTLEPWSHWLTGQQGVRPSPYYDPLQFAITEAHKRCMEVHVWLNPYRVTFSERTDHLHPDHLFFRKPELFVKYGGKYYFNPGLDETRQFLNRVVADIVKRYDIDAIHFDDYFYPYKVAGEEFQDDATFQLYPRGFAPDQKADWRRDNVNRVIEELHKTIKSIKPWVAFGISPFGVWRNIQTDPKGSATRAGVQNYDDLYADILKWLRKGWIDYVVPQLYWEIGKVVADYEVLVQWWSQHTYGKNLFIGLHASKLGSPRADAPWHRPNELVRQLRMNQSYPNIGGVFYFSAKGFVRNLQGLNDSLKATFYRHEALVPTFNNIQGRPSESPRKLTLQKTRTENWLQWTPVENTHDGTQVKYYVVYAFPAHTVVDFQNPAYILHKTTQTHLNLTSLFPQLKGRYRFGVTAINRYRIESKPVTTNIERL